MFEKLYAFLKKQYIFLFGVTFGATVASVVTALLASVTDADLLDIAEVLNVVECYEERTNAKK